MDVMKELKEVAERFDALKGIDSVRDFLVDENERLKKLGILVRDCEDLSLTTYTVHPEIRARWLLGQLREIAHPRDYVSKVRTSIYLSGWRGMVADALDVELHPKPVVHHYRHRWSQKPSDVMGAQVSLEVFIREALEKLPYIPGTTLNITVEPLEDDTVGLLYNLIVTE